MERTPSALTIAGSDSSAGAGIQADLKTFAALGVYGATVITALTAQNTTGVTDIHLVPPSHITAQMDAVFADLRIAAVKTGMLGGEEQILAVVEGLEKWAAEAPVVVDPVMVSTSGARLLEQGAEQALMSRLIPLATLITPNLPEAAVLLHAAQAASVREMEQQARALHALGAKAVLIKGGHGVSEDAVDILFDGAAITPFSMPRIHTRNAHGTGCTLASAIAAGLLLGKPLSEAVGDAKAYIQRALRAADALHVGRGAGPLNHFAGEPS